MYPKLNPDTPGQLIVDKRGKNIKYKKGSLFSWHYWRVTYKSMKLEHNLTPCTKINLKWLKDLNIRHDTIKLLEENIGKTFSDINCTDVFLGQSPKAIEIKNINKQMGPNQTYQLLHSKGNYKENEKTTYRMGKIVSNDATPRT